MFALSLQIKLWRLSTVQNTVSPQPKHKSTSSRGDPMISGKKSIKDFLKKFSFAAKILL